MNLAKALPEWDGHLIDGRFVGLGRSTQLGEADTFVAAGERGVVLVPLGRVGPFLDAHPGVHFATDRVGLVSLDLAEPSVHRAAVENRLLELGLLDELVRLAVPEYDWAPLDRPGSRGGAEYAWMLRTKAEDLMRRAEEAADRADVAREVVSRFGPLGIGLEVRGALAAAGGVSGVRVGDREISRVRAALDGRMEVVRRALAADPDARTFANKPGGTGFLEGEPVHGGDTGFATFVAESIRRVRLWGGLPAPAPDVPEDTAAWALLAPHHQTYAAWLELTTARTLRDALNGSSLLTPGVHTFPELRTADPDLGYLRRKIGGGTLTAPAVGANLIVVSLPDLELCTLAVCLDRRFGDDRLAGLIRSRGPAHARHELFGRISGLSSDDQSCPTPSDIKEWSDHVQAALDYFPKGVTEHTLEKWLFEYEWRARPRATLLRRAWCGLTALAPSLERYVADDGESRAAANLGTTPGRLSKALAGWAAAHRLAPEDAQLPAVIQLLLHGPELTDGDKPVQAQARRGLVELLTSERVAPGNPLAARTFRTHGELVGAVLGSDYATPTGRVYARAAPLQVVGRDHVELADGARKAAYFALAAGGFRVAGFAGDQFAVLTTEGNTAEADRAGELVRNSLRGWLDLVACAVTSEVVWAW